MIKKNIRSLSKPELSDFILSNNEKKYRVGQVYDWLWKNFISHFDEMTNVSLNLREILKHHFELHNITIHNQQESSDKTIKLSLKTHDGNLIESVLIPHKDRLTACISSQVGCSLDCNFCATGTMKLERNLLYDEIYNQVVLLNQLCFEKYNKKITNIVFMGMGEPLLNYNNVKKSIELLSSENGFAMSPRRVTVSTSGIAKMIKHMADDNLRCELALSLHATQNEQRTRLMSINITNTIEDLLDSLQYYFQKTKNKITLEYLLLSEINDGLEDAQRLVSLYRKSQAKVLNIIEYNKTALATFKPPSSKKIEVFRDYLSKKNVNVRIRRSRGKDIAAACGQLANIQKQ